MSFVVGCTPELPECNCGEVSIMSCEHCGREVKNKDFCGLHEQDYDVERCTRYWVIACSKTCFDRIVLFEKQKNNLIDAKIAFANHLIAEYVGEWGDNCYNCDRHIHEGDVWYSVRTYGERFACSKHCARSIAINYYFKPTEMN